ncbi:hypothetical protein D3C84_992330 [compost metagenome]
MLAAIGVLVVDIVVPGCAAHAQPIVLPAQVHFGKQVQAVGDQSTAEILVALALDRGVQAVGGWRIDQAAVLSLQAPGLAVLDGVVPAQFPVGVTQVHLHGLDPFDHHTGAA